MSSVSIDPVPLHGFRGESADHRIRPRGLTVALSREAGARGTTIARMVGEQLGWQVYDQEMLTFLANDEPARMELLRDLPPAERDWADSQFSDANTDLEPELMNAIRLTLALAARGDVVLVGRGSGFLLPNETTVHVRIVAPWESRVGYIAQSLRLPREDAVAEVRSRDEKRASLIQTLTGHDPTVASGYDLILNSARLGLESCAELIVQAVRLKQLSAAA